MPSAFSSAMWKGMANTSATVICDWFAGCFRKHLLVSLKHSPRLQSKHWAVAGSNALCCCPRQESSGRFPVALSCSVQSQSTHPNTETHTQTPKTQTLSPHTQTLHYQRDFHASSQNVVQLHLGLNCTDTGEGNYLQPLSSTLWASLHMHMTPPKSNLSVHCWDL